MVTPPEARKIASLDDHGRDFTVVDLRSPDSPRVWEVFPRTWAADGVILKEVPAEGGGLADVLAHHGLEGGTLVVVTSAGDDTNRILEFLGAGGLESALDRVRLVTVSEDGGLRYLGELLEDSVPSRIPVRLTLLGKGSPRSKEVKLPAVVKAVVPNTGDGRYIGIEGKSPGRSLPPRQWYALAGSGTFELTVDVAPSGAGDRWQVEARRHRVPCRPLAAPPRAEQLERMALIFDRTCPSHDKWDEASSVLSYYYARAEDRGEDPLDVSSGQEVPIAPAPGELNAEIRAGLAEAFAEVFASRPIAVELTWFADVEGNGIACPQGLEMPAEPFAPWGVVSSADLGHALEHMTYSPGLDLWDPLDGALLSTVQSMEQETMESQPILVVGNSPPYLPDDIHSPFRSLLTAEMRTTVRQTTPSFVEALRIADRIGVPVAYLFLTGHRFAGSDNREFLRYRRIQHRVKQALDRYLTVVEAEASVSGITKAVPKAVHVLARPSRVAVAVEDPS